MGHQANHETHDLLKECPATSWKCWPKGVGAWGDWFMEYRDEDGDGLPFEHGDDTGLGDTLSAAFADNFPDLCAYLCSSAVGDLGNFWASRN